MNETLEARLRDFEDGRAGASVRRLDLRNRTGVGLDDILRELGFSVTTRPFPAPGGGYLREDGTRTDQADDPDIVTESFYTQRDGGMVHVLPQGIPGDLRRPGPHASKSVLYNPMRPPTWDNQAFKVTNDGFPVPKSPHGSDGTAQLPDVDANEVYLDAVMREAYTDLVGDM
jgi:hypothetical protein